MPQAQVSWAAERPSLCTQRGRLWGDGGGGDKWVAVEGSSVEAVSRDKASLSFVSLCLAHSEYDNGDSFSLWNIFQAPDTCSALCMHVLM